jgi:hypothetical protein
MPHLENATIPLRNDEVGHSFSRWVHPFSLGLYHSITSLPSVTCWGRCACSTLSIYEALTRGWEILFLATARKVSLSYN